MPLIYDRESDRLVGGDFLREVSGRWTLSLILSLRRGKLLHETLGHLAAQYEGLPAELERAATPFATPLALIELQEFPADVEGATVALSVEALFALPQLSLAPPEYRQLGQLVTLLPATETLAASALPLDVTRLTSLARQLFLTLACGHCRAAISFSSARGSCITPEALTPDGEFVDVYWFTRASVARDGLRMFQYDDVARGLALVVRLAADVEADVEAALATAATTYARFGTPPRDVRRACQEAAERLRAGATQPLRDLAAAVRAGCC